MPRTNETGPQTPEPSTDAPRDRQASPEPPTGHHRAEAAAWADTATTTGGTTGITYALAAIAHAILAGQETHP